MPAGALVIRGDSYGRRGNCFIVEALCVAARMGRNIAVLSSVNLFTFPNRHSAIVDSGAKENFVTAKQISVRALRDIIGSSYV